MKYTKRVLVWAPIVALYIGFLGCASSRCPRDDYGETIRETNLIVREDGTRDFWRLTYKQGKRSYKDDEHYWVHIIDGPGRSCYTCAHGYGIHSGPPENPPSSDFLERLLKGFCESIMDDFARQLDR